MHECHSARMYVLASHVDNLQLRTIVPSTKTVGLGRPLMAGRVQWFTASIRCSQLTAPKPCNIRQQTAMQKLGRRCSMSTYMCQ